MKLKVAGGKKTETQDDNQRLEELDGTLKERIADTENENDDRGKEGEEEQDDTCVRGKKSSMHPVLLDYNDAPSYLKFNPYIRSGYRGYLTTKMCLESIFWWTNETVNIWSHIFGWMLFMGLTLYDLILLNIHASFADKFIVGLLLVCFQACMILSSMYHTFSCRSERAFTCFLSFDLFGIALSLLAIYMSGIYYAFWCDKMDVNGQLQGLAALSLVIVPPHEEAGWDPELIWMLWEKVKGLNTQSYNFLILFKRKRECTLTSVVNYSFNFVRN